MSICVARIPTGVSPSIKSFSELMSPGRRCSLSSVGLRGCVGPLTLRRRSGFPSLWCEVGLAEPGTPAERIKVVAREYLRLLLAYPGAMRALLDPHELDELLRPKDPSRYRTLVEYREALAHIVAEQERLLEEAISAGRSGEINVGAMTRTLTAAWLRIASHVWGLQTEPNAPRLFQKIADSTDAIIRELAPGSA
jgi:hypothetical protein